MISSRTEVEERKCYRYGFKIEKNLRGRRKTCEQSFQQALDLGIRFFLFSQDALNIFICVVLLIQPCLDKRILSKQEETNTQIKGLLEALFTRLPPPSQILLCFFLNLFICNVCFTLFLFWTTYHCFLPFNIN